MQPLAEALERALSSGGWWSFRAKAPEPVPACENCGEPVCVMSGNRIAISHFCFRCLDRLSEEYERRELAAAEKDPIRIRHKVNRTNIPEGFIDRLIGREPFEDTTAVLETTAFLGDAKKQILVLAGANGRGKTTAACWAVWENDKEGLYMTGAKLAATSTYHEEKWEPFIRAPMLIIDELTEEFFDLKNNASRKLGTLLIDRESRRRKTLLTTNIARELLTWSKGMADRIERSGVIVDLGGGIEKTKKPQAELALPMKEEPARQ